MMSKLKPQEKSSQERQRTRTSDGLMPGRSNPIRGTTNMNDAPDREKRAKLYMNSSIKSLCPLRTKALTMEYYLAIKKSKIMMFSEMDRTGDTMLSKISI